MLIIQKFSKWLELPCARIRKYRRVFLCYILPLTVLLTLTLHSQNWFGSLFPSCEPQTKIAFLKTHKCASSTIQNILFRFGESRELNFVFPLKGNYLGRSDHFDRNMIASVPWKNLEYHIFAVHTMWNTDEVRSVLGGHKKPSLISIIRDPVDLFESLYSFAQWDRLFNIDIKRFANAVSINASGADFLSVGGYTGHNQMLHDFGLPELNSTNVTMVKAKIHEIERDFDFILIAEHLDESLIMLRYDLCWPIQNIIHLSVNERQSNFRRKLDNETRLLLRKWLWADQMLYDHFIKVFKSKRAQFGLKRLEFEKQKLAKYNNFVKEYCGVKEGSFKSLKGNFKPSNLRVKGFKVNDNYGCEEFARSELAYIDILREKQKMRALVNTSTSVSPVYGEEENVKANENKIVADKTYELPETDETSRSWKKSYDIH